MAAKYESKSKRRIKKWIPRLEGLPEDTYKYYGGPNFSGRRLVLHNAILRMVLKTCRKSSNPQAIMMMGGPASGKSTALKVLDTTGYTAIDSDAIKGELPEYQKAVRAGAKNAAAMAHEESAHLADEALRKTVARGCNVILDGTGKNAEKYSRIMSMFHAHGYTVRLVYVHVDPALALPRAIKRADKSGRYVPEYVIEAAYASIPYNFGQLANRADSWTMFDTSAFPARFVANKEANGAPEIYRPDLLEDFLRRFPQRTALKMANPSRRNPMRNPAPINAKAVERALTQWMRSGMDDGETGLG